MDTTNLLLDSHDESERSGNRKKMLKEAGVASRRWFVNPRFWAAIIGVFVLVVSVVLVVVITTVSKNGKNAKEVKSIIDLSSKATTGFTRLGLMLDQFGSRISGSVGLNNSLSWMAQQMQDDGFRVRLEPVQIGHWVRNEESLMLNHPVVKSLPMLGLGGSVGTGASGVTGEVLVVENDAQLESLKNSVPGKIVLYNNAWDETYGKTVKYRSRGAVKASQYGAVAALVRSVTPFSLQTPHTGGTNYDPAVAVPIPIAAVTVEDASWMGRMAARGVTFNVTLKMGAQRLPTTTSYNIVADWVGNTHPDEFVVMGGHTDSWDVGQGAHDDAGGVFAAWEAMRMIKELGLVPKRTIRVVGWVDEEQGGAGAKQYVIDHAHELAKHVLAMESDQGTFKATDMLFKGNDKGFTGASKMGNTYLTKYLDVKVERVTYADADITPLAEKGVPTFSMRNVGNTAPHPKYFEYHHTHADTFDKIALPDFQNNAAVFAIAAWVAAQGEWPLK